MTIARTNDMMLTGIPRSGTTLICALLSKLPNTIALNEPLDTNAMSRLYGLPSDDIRCQALVGFMASQRQSILSTGRARALAVDGQACDNVFAAPVDGTRRFLGIHTDVSIERPRGMDFNLIIKHTAAFTALVNALPSYFPTFAVVRNPLAVLGSYLSLRNTAVVKIARGELPLVENREPEFARRLGLIADPIDRTIFILSWFYSRYTQYLPPAQVIRYEDVVGSRGKALAAIVPEAAQLDEPLESRNRNAFYDQGQLREVCQRLIATEGGWRAFYSNEEILGVLSDAPA